VLVFSRKAGEGLVIAGEIEVKILTIDRDHVKVGIEAPRHIPVHRHEIHEQILRENLAAAAGTAKDPESLKKIIANLRRK
jgi:carbon storage regulator